MKPVLEGVPRSVAKTGAVVLAVLLPVAVLLLSVPRGAYAKERTAFVTVIVKLASPPSAELNEDLYGFNLGYTTRFKEL